MNKKPNRFACLLLCGVSSAACSKTDSAGTQETTTRAIGDEKTVERRELTGVRQQGVENDGEGTPVSVSRRVTGQVSRGGLKERLNRAYRSAYGDGIVALYDVDASAYFNGREIVRLGRPVSTLSAAVPSWLVAKIDLKEALERALSDVGIGPHAIEVSPGSDVFKVTVYPLN